MESDLDLQVSILLSQHHEDNGYTKGIVCNKCFPIKLLAAYKYTKTKYNTSIMYATHAHTPAHTQTHLHAHT